MNLYRIAADLEDRNQPFVLATIIESSGSTPRSRAMMIVEANGTIHGTIGGGGSRGRGHRRSASLYGLRQAENSRVRHVRLGT